MSSFKSRSEILCYKQQQNHHDAMLTALFFSLINWIEKIFTVVRMGVVMKIGQMKGFNKRRFTVMLASNYAHAIEMVLINSSKRRIHAKQIVQMEMEIKCEWILFFLFHLPTERNCSFKQIVSLALLQINEWLMQMHAIYSWSIKTSADSIYQRLEATISQKRDMIRFFSSQQQQQQFNCCLSLLTTRLCIFNTFYAIEVPR